MECLSDVTIDLCGRPFLVYEADLTGKVGEFDLELAEEFFRSVATTSKMTAHIELVRSGNQHHGIEALFKGFAVALRRAVAVTGTGVPSTKGVL